MTRREGSTVITDYRGHEIRETLSGVWWRELGQTMTAMKEAKSLSAAMRAINNKLGPVKIKLSELKQPEPPTGPQPKYVSARPWIEWSATDHNVRPVDDKEGKE